MKRLILCAALIATPAYAADKAVILNEAEERAILLMIDEAVKAKGLEMAPNAVYLANKIKSAPMVTEQKPATPDKPAEGDKKP